MHTSRGGVGESMSMVSDNIKRESRLKSGKETCPRCKLCFKE